MLYGVRAKRVRVDLDLDLDLDLDVDLDARRAGAVDGDARGMARD